MEYPVFTVILLMTASFVAGFVDSIAGGGGLINTPSLLVCGVPPHVALGTGKFASVLGSLTSLWTYARRGLVVKSIVPTGFVAALAGSMAGAGLALVLDSEMLGRVLVFLLPVGMAASVFAGRMGAREDGELPERFLWSKVLGLCFFIGFYDGFFGPGTGTFFIIGLSLFLNIGLVRASATAKVFNMASNAGALAVFATGGVVSYSLAIPLALANIAGNQVGTRLAIKGGAQVVRRFVYVALSLLLATLVYKFFLAGMGF